MNAAKFFKIWLLGLCIGASGWATQALAGPPSADESTLVGTWLGEYAPAPGAPVQRFLTKRAPDGTFTLVSRMYEAGKAPTELVNTGIWGISNGMYFTVTSSVNGMPTNTRNPETISPYLVRELQKDSFTFQHVLTGVLLKVSRVAPETKLP
jgi:hypothetical protein